MPNEKENEMKEEFTNEEILEGIEELYHEWCILKAKEDGNSKVRLPDFETALNQLEERLSGGCPAIVKDALNSISLSAEAVEKIRTGLTMALDGWSLSASDYEEKYYPMAGPQSLRDILKTALALLPHADTGKGME